MRLPLIVKERLLCFELVDADGRVVARRTFLTWNGVAEDDRPEVVRKNFQEIAMAMNETRYGN